jgi:hypothetical protein
MLKEQKLELSEQEIEKIILNVAGGALDIGLKDKKNLLQEISPTVVSNTFRFSYIHKSFYEFFIA